MNCRAASKANPEARSAQGAAPLDTTDASGIHAPPAPVVVFKFLMFVAGDTPNSALALANLTAICRSHLPGRHAIDTVDVFREPQRALAEGIFCTPTLVRLAPGPIVRIVGTLVQTQTVLVALGLHAAAA